MNRNLKKKILTRPSLVMGFSVGPAVLPMRNGILETRPRIRAEGVCAHLSEGDLRQGWTAARTSTDVIKSTFWVPPVPEEAASPLLQASASTGSCRSPPQAGRALAWGRLSTGKAAPPGTLPSREEREAGVGARGSFLSGTLGRAAWKMLA